MKYLIIIINLFCFFSSTYAQKSNVDYYNLGIKKMGEGKYQDADKIFDKIDAQWLNKDVTNKRATCKLKLKDTIGYCAYLEKAIQFDDKNAEKLYCKKCANLDTIFIDVDGNEAIKSTAIAQKVTVKNKYTSETLKTNISLLTDTSKFKIKHYDSLLDLWYNFSEPTYLGGLEGLKSDLDSSFSKIKYDKEGVVKLSFSLNENGEMINIGIVSGPNSLQTQAITMVKTLKNWNVLKPINTKNASFGIISIRFKLILTRFTLYQSDFK